MPPCCASRCRSGTGRGTGPLAAAASLVKAAEAEAAAATAELDEPERDALRRAFGEGSTGKGVAAAIRGGAGALKDLEDRQKSRATRLKRDSLDRALLDLAGFYRDVLAVQFGADVELANAAQRDDLERFASAGHAGDDGTADPGDHGLPGAAGRQRGPAARGRGDDARPRGRLAHSVPRLVSFLCLTRHAPFPNVTLRFISVTIRAPADVGERSPRLAFMIPGSNPLNEWVSARDHEARPAQRRQLRSVPAHPRVRSTLLTSSAVSHGRSVTSAQP